MSQRCVEQVIGKLVTDEAFRLRFAAQPAAVLRELVAAGVELSSVEFRALSSIDAGAVGRFADAIDPRLQRAGVMGGRS